MVDLGQDRSKNATRKVSRRQKRKNKAGRMKEKKRKEKEKIEIVLFIPVGRMNG